jgi:hypothetical protein
MTKMTSRALIAVAIAAPLLYFAAAEVVLRISLTPGALHVARRWKRCR